MTNQKDIITYNSQDGKLSFNVNVFEQRVWLNQEQIAQLFGKNRRTISEHINNIFREGELDENVVCRNFRHTTEHGAIKGKQQNVSVKYYNLDMILSVGYRVKSARGMQFRLWANEVLKGYLVNGYSINETRIKKIEEKIDNLSSELRAEFKAEIKQINQSLLQIASKPINIYNQINLTSNKLEQKALELIDQLIIQTKTDNKLKTQLEEIKTNLKSTPKDQNTKEKITKFFTNLGDENSKLNKQIKSAGIAKKIIAELVKLGEKLRELFW
jgi:hypothetical protein